MKFTNWVLDKIQTYRPTEGPRQPQTLNYLGESLLAIRRGSGAVFGLDLMKVEAEGRTRIETELVNALLAWRKLLEAEADVHNLLALSRYGELLGMSALHYTKPPVKRVPLRCDPLGTRDGLSREWLARLKRLDALVAGRRTVTGYAASWLAESAAEAPEDPDYPSASGPARFETPKTAALYEYVLKYETESGEAYPREFAALHATVGAIFVGDEGDPPFLDAIPLWFWAWPGSGIDERELGARIGTGGYFQGSLWIKPNPEQHPLEAEVIDFDDDGVVRVRFPNLGALLDLIMER